MKKFLVVIFISLLFKTVSNGAADPETRVYAVKDGEELILDVFSPDTETNEARPVIIFMHGGGFSAGSPKNESLVRLSKLANERGYVSVLISYRLTRKGESFGCSFEASGKIETFKKSAEDFLDAVLYVITHSDELNIDSSKIIAGGSSAGAEAVLSAVYNQSLMFDDVSKYSKIHFAGVLSMAGAMVDARYINEKSAIPAVFFHGTEDNLVPYGTAPHHYCDEENAGYLILDGSRTIANKLKEYNTSYLLYSFKGGRHEISGVQFDYIDETFDFFDRILNGEKSIQFEMVK